MADSISMHVTPQPPTLAPTSVEQPLFVRAAAAAGGGDQTALVKLRDIDLGYFSLPGKQRLSVFKAVRHAIKEHVAPGQRPAAFGALEAAFPVPYAEMKDHLVNKAIAKAAKTFLQSPPQAGGSELIRTSEESASKEASGAPPLPTPLTPGTAHNLREARDLLGQAGIPQGWVRFHAIDGFLDLPRDAFLDVPYFKQMLTGSMEGGKDASGAQMIDMSVHTLRNLYAWQVNRKLPRLSDAEMDDVRIQANGKCMYDLMAYIERDRTNDLTDNQWWTLAHSVASHMSRNGRHIEPSLQQAFRNLAPIIKSSLFSTDDDPSISLHLPFASTGLYPPYSDIDNLLHAGGHWTSPRLDLERLAEAVVELLGQLRWKTESARYLSKGEVLVFDAHRA